MEPLLSEIELFTTTHGLSEWQFGQRALGDRHFVRQLRAGRDIRLSTERKVRDFMLTYRSEQEAA
jgi:hypothetical protein